MVMSISTDMNAGPKVQLNDAPHGTWTDEQYAEYANRQIGLSAEMESTIGMMARRSSVAFYRAGMALSMARDRRKPHGDWVAWQEQNGLKRTTVFEAIQLFERAKTEEAVANLGLTEAKKRFGISGNSGRTTEVQRHINRANKEEKALRTPVKSRLQPLATPGAMLRVAAAQIDTAIAAVDVAELAKEEVTVLIERIKVQVARLEAIVLSHSVPTASGTSADESDLQPHAA